MNEINFAPYDSYFSSTSQIAIDNALMQSVDYDMPPQNVHYLTNTASELPSVGEQRHAQTNNGYAFLTHREEMENNKEPATNSLKTTTSSSAGTQSTSSAYGNIPFVQIHTIDVQQQRTSYGNVFRRNVSRQEEIKSEPIKSESADASKERTNATPTPPRAPSTIQAQTDEMSKQCQKAEVKNTERIEMQYEEGTESEQTCLADFSSSIYKCKKCPYVSLNENERSEHQCVERPQMKCPGCNNIFYVQKSLELHLRVDHFMSEDATLKLLNCMLTLKAKESQNAANEAVAEQTKQNDTSHEQPQRKSRIYLKNVECLREPNRQPIEQTENQLTSNNANNSTHSQNSKPLKQKISIKSVDVLREPALLRRDYLLDNVNFSGFVRESDDLNIQITDLNEHNNYENYNPNSDICNVNNSNVDSTNCNISSNTDSLEKPRRPKIYVKSVESFNLMPLNSIPSTNNDFVVDHNNMSSSTAQQSYDNQMVHLPFQYESNSSVNDNVNYMSSHLDMDNTYQFINNSVQNGNYVTENDLYVTTDGDDVNEQMENENITHFNTNKTISNSHVEHRGTLHLRTVDELNLMNENEVQHLIAPHLDNNHACEIMPKDDSIINMSSMNFIGDSIYETETIKLQDLDSQMVNDWPETYEDLTEDFNGIITDVTNNANSENTANSIETNPRTSFNSLDNLDTPQASLITIRDIEELTGGTTMGIILPQFTNCLNDSNMHDISTDMGTAVLNEQMQNISITQDVILNTSSPPLSDTSEKLKRELSNATPKSEDNLVTTNAADSVLNSADNETSNEAASSDTRMSPQLFETSNADEQTESTHLNNKFTSSIEAELPPLVPVTNAIHNTLAANEGVATTSNDMSLSLPPLIKINKSIAKPPPSPSGVAEKPTGLAPTEKGRIYVANNLMEPPKKPIAVSATCGTSVRGRPFGSNRTGITQLKQKAGITSEDAFVKCSLKGCAFRFKKPDTLEYHQKCHDLCSSNPQATICPECKSTDFNNWNTLHTHLWRSHQIDMELYKCELCEFKTPIFSRLVNTHAKIHFDDRNYKCEQCGKGFKNSKQLKNHRRWHRVQAVNIVTTPKEPPLQIQIHRCTDCGSTFSQQKTLRTHCCKSGENTLKCDICQKVMSSKSSLTLHLLTHSTVEKRFKCQECDYATNDHNAFRRHRMRHENKKMYECKFCDYKSLQSVTYQKHIRKKHPDKVDTVLHNCQTCSFTTVNASLLVVHQAKHHKVVNEEVAKSDCTQLENMHGKVLEVKSVVGSDIQKSKIKVKSNLFSTT